MKKIRVGILFGGRSAEHEVSLQSAKNVIEAIDKDKYEVVLIGIDKTGKWYLNDPANYLLNSEDPKLIRINSSPNQVTLVGESSSSKLVNLTANNLTMKQFNNSSLDVIFPVLHGTYGEDGTIQGMLKLANVPFVGCGVLASAVGMDKDVMKRLMRDAGIPIAKFKVLYKTDFSNHPHPGGSPVDFRVLPPREKEHLNGLSSDAFKPSPLEGEGRVRVDKIFQQIKQEFGLPVFVKPANLGSSVGVSKVTNQKEFDKAIQEAFLYDHKILVEEAINGREVECAVLGNENPQASGIGEVIPQKDFYSYEAKYIDELGAKLEIPAKLTPDQVSKIQKLAIRTFKVLCCEGMARVDMFLKEDGEVVVNEINTIPGFTKISMYPKLWQESGLSYPELIDKLIDFAIERFKKDQQLKTQFT